MHLIAYSICNVFRCSICRRHFFSFGKGFVPITAAMFRVDGRALCACKDIFSALAIRNIVFLPVIAAWDAVRIQSVHHLLRVMK